MKHIIDIVDLYKVTKDMDLVKKLMEVYFDGDFSRLLEMADTREEFELFNHLSKLGVKPSRAYLEILNYLKKRTI